MFAIITNYRKMFLGLIKNDFSEISAGPENIAELIDTNYNNSSIDEKLKAALKDSSIDDEEKNIILKSFIKEKNKLNLNEANKLLTLIDDIHLLSDNSDSKSEKLVLKLTNSLNSRIANIKANSGGTEVISIPIPTGKETIKTESFTEVGFEGINSIDKEIGQEYTIYISEGVEYLIDNDYIATLNEKVLGVDVKERFDDLSQYQKARVFRSLTQDGKITTLSDYLDAKNRKNDIKVNMWEKGTTNLENTDNEISKGEDVVEALADDKYSSDEVFANLANEISHSDDKVNIISRAMGVDLSNPSNETKQLLVNVGNNLKLITNKNTDYASVNVEAILQLITDKITDDEKGANTLKSLINADGNNDFSINYNGFAFDGRSLVDGQILTGNFKEAANEEEKSISMSAKEIDLNKLPKGVSDGIKEGETISVGKLSDALNGVFITKRKGKIFAIGDVVDNSSTSLGIYGDTQNVDWEKIATHAVILALAEGLWSYSGNISNALGKIKPELSRIKWTELKHGFSDLKIGSVSLGTFAAGAATGATLGVILTKMYYSKELSIAENVTDNEVIKKMMMSANENIEFKSLGSKVNLSELKSYSTSTNDKIDYGTIYYPTTEIAELTINEKEVVILQLAMLDNGEISDSHTMVTLDGERKNINDLDHDTKLSLKRSIQHGEGNINNAEAISENILNSIDSIKDNEVSITTYFEGGDENWLNEFDTNDDGEAVVNIDEVRLNDNGNIVVDLDDSYTNESFNEGIELRVSDISSNGKLDTTKFYSEVLKKSFANFEESVTESKSDSSNDDSLDELLNEEDW